MSEDDDIQLAIALSLSVQDNSATEQRRKQEQEEEDRLFAQKLQEEENKRMESRPTPSNSTPTTDLDEVDRLLALQLQLEEKKQTFAESIRNRLLTNLENLETQTQISPPFSPGAIYEPPAESPFQPSIPSSGVSPFRPTPPPQPNPPPQNGGGESYEDFLALTERLGSAKVGLDEDQLQVLPSFPYKQSTKQNEDRCTICIEDFVEGEQVACVPCFHLFHKDCIEKWLKMKNECPICKGAVVNRDS
jgi:hypothetical protein